MTESQPKRTKRQRPIMALLDLLGRRWTLRVIYELRDGPLTSRGLRKACDDVSPSVLQQRLDDLRDARIIELRVGAGYMLTERGAALGDVLMALNAWAEERPEQKPRGPVV